MVVVFKWKILLKIVITRPLINRNFSPVSFAMTLGIVRIPIICQFCNRKPISTFYLMHECSSIHFLQRLLKFKKSKKKSKKKEQNQKRKVHIFFCFLQINLFFILIFCCFVVILLFFFFWICWMNFYIFDNIVPTSPSPSLVNFILHINENKSSMILNCLHVWVDWRTSIFVPFIVLRKLSGRNFL